MFTAAALARAVAAAVESLELLVASRRRAEKCKSRGVTSAGSRAAWWVLYCRSTRRRRQREHATGDGGARRKRDGEDGSEMKRPGAVGGRAAHWDDGRCAIYCGGGKVHALHRSAFCVQTWTPLCCRQRRRATWRGAQEARRRRRARCKPLPCRAEMTAHRACLAVPFSCRFCGLGTSSRECPRWS